GHFAAIGVARGSDAGLLRGLHCKHGVLLMCCVLRRCVLCRSHVSTRLHFGRRFVSCVSAAGIFEPSFTGNDAVYGKRRIELTTRLTALGGGGRIGTRTAGGAGRP